MTSEIKHHAQPFFLSFPLLLFYSRENIKHSENIFHILRAIQNILHGFSSWIHFFNIHQFSDSLTCTITKINRSNPGEEENEDINEKEREREKVVELNGGLRKGEGYIIDKDREKDS